MPVTDSAFQNAMWLFFAFQVHVERQRAEQHIPDQQRDAKPDPTHFESAELADDDGYLPGVQRPRDEYDDDHQHIGEPQIPF